MSYVHQVTRPTNVACKTRVNIVFKNITNQNDPVQALRHKVTKIVNDELPYKKSVT